jgi:monoamine oxidase
VAVRDVRGVRVVVVGAGLAGLTAARHLAAAGADVRVLEARARIGGRVWTRRDPADGVHVEAGGDLIEGEHRALRRLAAELGLRLRPVLRQGFGSVLRVEGRLRRFASQARPWARLRSALQPDVDAFAAAGRDWSSAVAVEIGRRSLAARLRDGGAGAETRALGEALRGFYVADPEQLSALVAVDQVAGADTPGQTRMYRVEGGNDRLAAAIVAALPADAVALRTQVLAVRTGDDGVRVIAESARGRRFVVTGDYAVVTLPAPVLRDLPIDPPLDALRRRALARLPNGAATKAAVRYDQPWWRCRGAPRAFGTNLPCGAVWEAAEEQRGAAVLTCLGGGANSATLQRLLASDAGRIRALDWLGVRVAGRLLAEPVVWERDPFARGGYAVFGPAFDPRWRASLAHSHGRLFFAGEHTSPQWPGFMNGAEESGIAAADAIRQLGRLRHRR